jgi:putative ABC transport system permease protein
VRRRRLQTIVIGVVVGLSAMLSVVALGLLAASTAPFEQAYARLQGAHLTASFDASRTTAEQVSTAARQPGVAATAGPFPQVVLTVEHVFPPSMTVVARAGSGGPVDRLNVWKGHWLTGPGQIVLAGNPADPPIPLLGQQIQVGGGELTVVGLAYSVGHSANAWITPAEMAARHPTGYQMLYRFAHAGTASEMSADQSAVTAGLPLLSAQSYLTIKATAASQPGTFVPFLIVFGCLGLAVAVLIVGNVVSGAVIAGFRHIGMLKALGFTPGQVLAIYQAMVAIPAVAGSLLGTALGTVLGDALLSKAFRFWGTGDVSVAWWVPAAALLGLPVVVALSALVPALRARSLPAAQAISAGSAQHRGRALRVQRRLGGARLPRPVSLGLGLPFARPGRSVMTLAAVILGVTSVTFAIGLATSLTRYADADPDRGVQVEVHTPPEGLAGVAAVLSSLPGTAQVTASSDLGLVPAGGTDSIVVRFWSGDEARSRYQVVRGHWFDGPGQIAVSERFLKQHGLALGDTMTFQPPGRSVTVRIVAELLVSSAETIFSNAATLAEIAPGTQPDLFQIKLKPGTSVQQYLGRVAAADPRLDPQPAESTDGFIVLIVSTVTLLTLMLGAVAALGVFNTVVLDTRERRRDLGMLKSIGMTPGQVSTMLVTSMAVLGALSGVLGIPIGVLAHALVLPAMGRSAQVRWPAAVLHVYQPETVALLALAGAVIAVLGAYLPARSAGRSTIAAVLHNE